MGKPLESALIEVMKINGRIVHGFAVPYDGTIVPNRHERNVVGFDRSKGVWYCYGGLLSYPIIIPFSSVEHLHLQEGDMFDCQISQVPRGNVIAINLEKVTLSEEDRKGNEERRETMQIFKRLRERLRENLV